MEFEQDVKTTEHTALDSEEFISRDFCIETDDNEALCHIIYSVYEESNIRSYCTGKESLKRKRFVAQTFETF